MKRMFILLALVGLSLADTVQLTPNLRLPTQPSPESAAVAAARHARVAARRKRVLVMVQRGMSELAPADSLTACAMAMDFGADGCTVDLYRTRDGVLVLFPYNTVDRITDGFGAVSDFTYAELRRLHPIKAFGQLQWGAPTTFAALLDAARQRAMMLGLNLRAPGIEAEVGHLLDEADAWDQVVAVTPSAGAAALARPNLQTLSYKSPVNTASLWAQDGASVLSLLAHPGQMLRVADPRPAVRALGRLGHVAEAYTRTYQLTLHPDVSVAGELPWTPMHYVRQFARSLPAVSADALVQVLRATPPAATNAQQRAEAILRRAWAAQQLGTLGKTSTAVRRALEVQLAAPTPSPDARFDGLDAAMAARALGQLHITSAARQLVTAYRKLEPPENTTGGAASPGGLSATGRDRCGWDIMAALAELPCGPAHRFLWNYVLGKPGATNHLNRPFLPEATRALLAQRLTWTGIADVIRSKNPAVRATAIWECLDHPTGERGLALHAAAPWAFGLPTPRR